MRDEKNSLWSPSNDDKSTEPERQRVEAIVTDVAGRKIRRGEDELPGLEAAVRSRVADMMHTDAYRELMREQVRSFADELRERWPDAYLINEQTVEQALQTVASGGRAARMAAGHPVSDPAAWEDALGWSLLDDPTIPLILEMTRQPRPSIPPVPPPHAEWWGNVRLGSDVVFVEHDDEQLTATVSVEPASCASRVEGGLFDGWFWFATHESRRFNHPDFRHRQFLLGERYRVAERNCSAGIRDGHAA